jgi:hypothetical protein
MQPRWKQVTPLANFRAVNKSVELAGLMGRGCKSGSAVTTPDRPRPCSAARYAEPGPAQNARTPRIGGRLNNAGQVTTPWTFVPGAQNHGESAEHRKLHLKAPLRLSLPQ